MEMKAPDDTGDPTLSLVSSTTPGDGRRRRQTTKKTKGVDGLPPCLVCGEPASGLHYGVNSCSACKVMIVLVDGREVELTNRVNPNKFNRR